MTDAFRLPQTGRYPACPDITQPASSLRKDGSAPAPGLGPASVAADAGVAADPQHRVSGQRPTSATQAPTTTGDADEAQATKTVARGG
jgi:hypothetical protein